MKNEVWKDIEGYEGLYQVSNLGRVKSLKRFVNCKNGKRTVNEKILIQHDNTHGYCAVILSKNCKTKNCTVHRLVAKAFIPNLENKEDINHINGVKTDNYVDNLEWVTRRENIIHSWNMGLSKYHDHTTGKTDRLCKNSKSVNQYDMNGNFIKNWGSISQISRELGYCGTEISKCCRGLVKHSHHYVWKFLK